MRERPSASPRRRATARTIVPFTAEHLDDAIVLLQARDRRLTDTNPSPPVLYDDPEQARQALDRLFRAEHARGVAALRAGRLVGYLIGTARFPLPTRPDALFVRPRSLTIVQEGYAAEPDDAAETYRELYGALAADSVRDGLFAHTAELVGADRSALEAWFSLGFGRNMVRGVRDAALPVAVEVRGDIEIHQATEEDIAVINELVVANFRYHTGSPVFQAYFRETEDETRAMEREQLADPANVRWVAYQDGRPVALQTFYPWRDRPGARFRTVHLQHGFTSLSARGGGVGATLLAHAMAWAREEGFERCTVNWLSANLLGARFWQAHGFRPVAHSLFRHIDERIAWAHPSG